MEAFLSIFLGTTIMIKCSIHSYQYNSLYFPVKLLAQKGMKTLYGFSLSVCLFSYCELPYRHRFFPAGWLVL